MRKKNAVVALVLSLALCLGSVGSVFANTYEGIAENTAEKHTYTFAKDYKNGGYNLVDTEELKAWVDAKKDMVIVDTMPAASSYNKQHVPGAINKEAGSGSGAAAYQWKDGQKEDLLKAMPTKTVKKTTLKKVSKAAYNKLAKADRATKKVNGKTVYYKKTVKEATVADKDATVVVYCGFIGCARSHIAAKYLVEQGYKNVYRYGGGIFAWVDAGYPVEKVEAAN